MMNTEYANTLIGQVYDASLDPDQWPELLCNIADACRMENAALVVIDPGSSFSSVLSPRSDPAVASAYNDYWWQHDPTTETASRSPVGHITTLADTGRERFLASAFHNEFWCSSGLGADRVAANLFAEGDAFSSIVLQPSVHRDSIDTETLQVAELLIPHIARAVTIGRKIHNLELKQAAWMSSAPPDHAGSIIVDQGGRCLHADMAAEDLMRSSAVHKLESGIVQLSDDKANVWLQAVLQSLARSSLYASTTKPIRLKHAPDQPSLELEILPCRTGVKNPMDRQTVAKLVFRNRGLSKSAQLQSLRNRFGLTPAEATLAIEMLKGDGRAAAASRCGISINTARTHLTRIFEKTGISRQAELVRIMMDHLQ